MTKKRIYSTTIEVDNITRDIITQLAKIEAARHHLPKLSAKDYLIMHFAHEKAAVIDNK